LPRPKRDATTALYAFLRVTDDLADEPGDPAAKRAKLAEWRTRLDGALSGTFTHRVHAALADAVRTFAIPPQYLHDVLDGVESDLDPTPFATFADLDAYCHRVASAVGLACLHIWGNGGGCEKAAGAAGVAFQLTNVLRDLGEDLARGRVYLPRDELARFGCPPVTWRERGPAFRAMMRFQVERARGYYDEARPLDALLSTEGRAVVRLMTGMYRGLLDEIERRDYDVFTARVRVGRLTKLRLLAGAWLVKWRVL
jgi:phytoene synthase